LDGDVHQTRLDLIEWITPPSPPSADPRPNQVGVPRLALWVKNLDAMYADLSAQGVNFVAPPVGPFPEWKISRMVCAVDPDGLLVELLEFERRAQELYENEGT
jgi:hypothetical protein